MRYARVAVVVGLLAGLPGTASAAGGTIVASLPLQGDARPQTLDVSRGMRLALAEHGGTAGGGPIRLLVRDASTAAAGKWDIARVALNARRAAQDKSTIAYLGEFNSAASTISVPILNEVGVLVVSPSNTYVGLTRAEAGGPGEPDKYYPTRRRTYGRVAPADHQQAAALARWLAASGVKRPFLVDDRESYGSGMRKMLTTRLRALGISPAGRAGVSRGRAAKVARTVAAAKPDAVVYLGIARNGAAAFVNAVGRRLRGVPIFGADGVAEPAFTRHVDRALRARVHLTVPTVPDAAYGPAAQAFVDRFSARYHHAPAPYAIFGYEAMAVVLDAIDRAAPAGGTRQQVVDAFFATRDRDSVLGRYSIDANGDTTLAAFGGYAVTPGGALRFDRVLDASPLG